MFSVFVLRLACPSLMLICCCAFLSQRTEGPSEGRGCRGSACSGRGPQFLLAPGASGGRGPLGCLGVLEGSWDARGARRGRRGRLAFIRAHGVPRASHGGYQRASDVGIPNGVSDGDARRPCVVVTVAACLGRRRRVRDVAHVQLSRFPPASCSDRGDAHRHARLVA